MSTDEYPTCDLSNSDLVPEKLVPAGAAALLYRNRDDLWPEFARQDLVTACPGIEGRVLAWDGAMIEDVLTVEVAGIGTLSNPVADESTAPAQGTRHAQ